MSHNSFGRLFRFTSWGESHGAGVGCVVDGAPPRLSLSEADVQHWLDKRRPGQSRFVSPRRESDRVKILSGLMEEGGETFTTGAPISMLIENEDARSEDYDALRDVFRPGHSDYVYQRKYGIRDHRGGGRSSARETAVRVAAGAVARKILPEIRIRSAVLQLGEKRASRERWDWDEAERNLLRCPDVESVKDWEAYLDGLREAGSSCGAVIEIEVSGVPVGLGAPIYGKLDADLAAALMSVNAVKGVEIGEGFGSAALRGEENADEMRMKKGKGGEVVFLSNHSGGVMGGISTGQDLVLRFVVKPTSSIRVVGRTVTSGGEDAEVSVRGRHDPCVGIRAGVVGEAMVACVLADHFLRHRGQIG